MLTWIATIAIGSTLAITAFCFVAGLTVDDERWQARTVYWFRWTVVATLGSFNIAIFRHIIEALLSF
ncbi:MAG TPA: hypothetical protein VFV25_01125 [Methylibium sp.]